MIQLGYCWFKNCPPYMEGRGRWEEEADHFIWVSDNFRNKEIYVWGLSWALGEEISVPPTSILKVYREAWMGFSYIHHHDGLSSTLLSQGCVLGSGFHCGNGGRDRMNTPRTGEEMRSLWMSGSSLRVNQQSGLLNDLLQQIDKPHLSVKNKYLSLVRIGNGFPEKENCQ